jgi:hypothetical protein
VKKFSAALAAAALLCAAGAAEAASYVRVGERSGVFGFDNVSGGDFAHTFAFTWPSDGKSSAVITSIRISALTDLNFTKVQLNGVDFQIGSTGHVEYRSLNGVPVAGGPQTLVVEGRSGGNGSYAGVLAFSPSDVTGAGPVPEATTWGLMIAGFGLVGAAVRRRAAVVA